MRRRWEIEEGGDMTALAAIADRAVPDRPHLLIQFEHRHICARNVLNKSSLRVLHLASSGLRTEISRTTNDLACRVVHMFFAIRTFRHLRRKLDGNPMVPSSLRPLNLSCRQDLVGSSLWTNRLPDLESFSLANPSMAVQFTTSTFVLESSSGSDRRFCDLYHALSVQVLILESILSLWFPRFRLLPLLTMEVK